MPLPRSIVVGAAAAVFVAILYWTYVRENYGMRVAVISVALAALATDAAASMIRRVPAEDRAVYWPTGWAFAFAGVFLAVQAGAAFMGYYTTYLAPMPIEVPLTICANVAYVGCGFGMLLVAHTRLRHTAERMAMFDPLTNLPNRRVLLDRLLEAEFRALGKGSQLGVIYLDLDGFKVVNDTMGHQAGDELLRGIGSAMLPVLGPGDCLARVGGDEFVALVEDVEGRAELTALAERLKAAVENQRIPANGTRVRASYGIAIFPADGQSAHDVMREADSAMYDAKRQTRNTSQTVAR
jgi:diguanylate cyclase (GGDEF)-like protein